MIYLEGFGEFDGVGFEEVRGGGFEEEEGFTEERSGHFCGMVTVITANSDDFLAN